MDIDTVTIRRLRDGLLAEGVIERAGSPGEPATTDSRALASKQRVGPFIETMYLVMLADGEADTSERAAIASAARLLTGGLLSDADINELLDRCESGIREHGAVQRLQSIGARLSADRLGRETAFTLAAAVALADDSLHAAEIDLVGSVAEWYGISSRRARELVGSA